MPLGGGFLYVEPVYARGGSANYPLLKKVGVSYGDKTVFKDTLADALNAVFGADGATPPTTTTTRRTTTPRPPRRRPPATPRVDQAIKDAQKAYDDGQKALAKGDWKAYGDARRRSRTRCSRRPTRRRTAEPEPKPADREPEPGRAPATGADPGRPVGSGQAPPRAVVALCSHDAGWSSSVARWAHNPEVAGSNPVPATD